ncbi:MAG: hypothetical protein ACRD1X_05295 [Vicinamibacteria bacterium]
MSSHFNPPRIAGIKEVHFAHADEKRRRIPDMQEFLAIAFFSLAAVIYYVQASR